MKIPNPVIVRKEEPRADADTCHMWLQDLQRPRIELSAWELGFLDNVSDQLERTGHLTDGQIFQLEKIHKEKGE